jgi:tetratricopeptide (TPR) repeat protein
MRPALIAAAVTVAVLAAAAPAQATPSQDLARAREAFRRGDFATALPLLNYLLYPTPRLAQTSDLVEAHVLLAVCAFETGDRETATREFEEALFLQSDLDLQGNALFSKPSIEFFAQTRAAVEERSRRDAEQRSLAEERERLRKYRESLIVYEVRPYYVNFIPFGAGQFQNRQRGKGLAFASAEVATGALSAGIWLYLVGQYGYGGRVPPEDAANVLLLQQIEIGSGVACLGLVAWGVVDSLLNYKPRAQIEGDDSLLPDLVPPPDRSPKARPKPKTNPRPTPGSAPSSLRLAPTPLPGGVGASLSWEF